MYLNCPSCGLSMRRASTAATVGDCPRCRGRFNRQVPLFLTERRYGGRFPDAPAPLPAPAQPEHRSARAD